LFGHEQRFSNKHEILARAPKAISISPLLHLNVLILRKNVHLINYN